MSGLNEVVFDDGSKEFYPSTAVQKSEAEPSFRYVSRFTLDDVVYPLHSSHLLWLNYLHVLPGLVSSFLFLGKWSQFGVLLPRKCLVEWRCTCNCPSQLAKIVLLLGIQYATLQPTSWLPLLGLVSDQFCQLILILSKGLIIFLGLKFFRLDLSLPTWAQSLKEMVGSLCNLNIYICSPTAVTRIGPHIPQPVPHPCYILHPCDENIMHGFPPGHSSP